MHRGVEVWEREGGVSPLDRAAPSPAAATPAVLLLRAASSVGLLRRSAIELCHPAYRAVAGADREHIAGRYEPRADDLVGTLRLVADKSGAQADELSKPLPPAARPFRPRPKPG